MRQAGIVILSALVLMLIGSCTSIGGPANYTPAEDLPTLPEGDADIKGTITKLEQGSGGALLRILVEERPADQGGSLKDMVTITVDTQIYREKQGRLRKASFDQLRQGVKVAAWYDGAVAESYPRQARAVAIVIAE